ELVHDEAMRQIEEGNTGLGHRRRLGQRGCRGHHRAQERQGDTGPNALEECPSWKVLPGNEHYMSLPCDDCRPGPPGRRVVSMAKRGLLDRLRRCRHWNGPHPELITM